MYMFYLNAFRQLNIIECRYALNNFVFLVYTKKKKKKIATIRIEKVYYNKRRIFFPFFFYIYIMFVKITL